MRKHNHTLFWLVTLLSASMLLGCRSAASTSQPTEAAPLPATEALGATPTPQRESPTAAATPRPTATAKPTATPSPTASPQPTATATPTETPTPTPTSTATPIPTPVQTEKPLPQESVITYDALALRDDETVAPPLTVIVSANRLLQGYRFKLTGLLRNDDTQPYAGLGLIATFFREDGSRFGPVRATLPCPILNPGESCPFVVEAVDKDLTEVMLHPEGYPASRQALPASVTIQRHYVDELGYVHLKGLVTNPNPVPLRSTTIVGALTDRRGEIVGVGTALVLESIPSKGSASFEMLIRYVPYTGYLIFTQALP